MKAAAYVIHLTTGYIMHVMVDQPERLGNVVHKDPHHICVDNVTAMVYNEDGTMKVTLTFIICNTMTSSNPTTVTLPASPDIITPHVTNTSVSTPTQSHTVCASTQSSTVCTSTATKVVSHINCCSGMIAVVTSAICVIKNVSNAATATMAGCASTIMPKTGCTHAVTTITLMATYSETQTGIATLVVMQQHAREVIEQSHQIATIKSLIV